MAYNSHNPSPYLYPPHVPEGPESPKFTGSRLLMAAQWTALVAAIVTFLAGIVAAAAVASSYDWGDTPRLTHTGASDLARNGGALIIIIGVITGAFVGVVIYTVARGLFEHPRGGAIAFFAVAGIVAAISVVLLAVPDLVLGEAGNAAARTAESPLSDAQFAGLALLAGAALAAAAGGLTVVELARVRRRDSAKSAEQHTL